MKSASLSTQMQLDKRDILSDPVEAFSRYKPNPDADEIVALDALRQQLQLLQQQHRNIKASTKILSRKIGQAKRNNGPVKQLMTSMHELSTQLKAIKNDITNIENLIIGFFEIDNDNNPTEVTTPEESGRVYTYTHSDEKDVKVTLLGDELSEWNSYVLNNPAASIYHRSEWKKLVNESYGLDACYYVARYSDQSIAGILPLIRLKSLLFGDYLVSMPYFMRGGAIADHPSVELKLMQAADDHAAGMGIDHIEYRDDISRAELPVRTEKVNMVLQLPDSHEELWKRFTPKLRSQIRRPQRENTQIHIGRNEYLDEFYTVYARNMRDLGSPVHSKKFIGHILDSFPENSWIIVLHLDNKPVATGLLLQHERRVDIPLASTIRDINPFGINMLMYWEVLKFSIDRRCNQFDFGRSSLDSGTYRFKQQWGAKPKQLYLHYWLNNAKEIPSLNPSNPKYTALITIWKHLPVKLTKWLGPRIVKNLP